MTEVDTHQVKAAPRSTTWLRVRQTFYVVTMAAMLVPPFWFRFSRTGIEVFYRFVLNVEPGSYEEDLVGYRFAVIGVIVGAIAMVIVLLLAIRRYPRSHVPLGAAWAMMVIFLAVFAAFVLYGHYFAR